jgi:hypothetical protein
MAKVKKKEPRIEKCMLCFKPINLDIDNYVNLIDYLQGKYYGEGFYHNTCYHEAISKRTSMQNVAMGLVKRTHKMLDNLEGKKEEFYVG